MKKIFIYFLSLTLSSTIIPAEMKEACEKLKASGYLSIVAVIPTYTGQDKFNISTTFNTTLEPQDLLIEVIVYNSESSDWETNYDSVNPLIKCFPKYIPLKLLKTGNRFYREGESFSLTRSLNDGTSGNITFTCSQRSCPNHQFSNKGRFEDILNSLMKFKPSDIYFQPEDKEMLIKLGVLPADVKDCYYICE